MIKKYAKDYSLIAVGTLIMALGYSYFLIPNDVAAGGASGAATILYSKFHIPVSLTVFLINAALFSVSWKTMPKSVFVRSAFGTATLTLFLELTADVPAFTDDVLLASSFGGVLVGIGVGIVVKYGASTGGSDFLAIILHKAFRQKVSVATLILIIDGIVIVSAGVAFNDYTLMLYTVISAYISSKIIDGIVEGGNTAKSVYIISAKSEEISNAIMEKLQRGTTGIYGKGMYTKKDTTLVLCVVTRNEIPKIRSLVKEIDPNAFIILSDVREVLGEGF